MIVMSAPSGGGKSTLCRRLLSEYGGIDYSISCTTRAPRGGEKDGVHYHFMKRNDFDRAVQAGLFLEHAEVHGNMYGTLRETVEKALSSGQSVILDIDVQGARQIRQAVSGKSDLIARSFLDIFITPPSLDALRQRLVGRGEDSESVIELRLGNAQREMLCSNEYMYVIENDVIDKAYRNLVEILEKESSL